MVSVCEGGIVLCVEGDSGVSMCVCRRTVMCVCMQDSGLCVCWGQWSVYMGDKAPCMCRGTVVCVCVSAGVGDSGLCVCVGGSGVLVHM